MIIINVSEEVIKEKHICYFTQIKECEGKIALYEVYEAFYKHPEAPEQALIQRIETRVIAAFNRNSVKASNLILLEAANNASKLFANTL